MNATSILSLLTSSELTLWLLTFLAALYARLHRSYVAVLAFLGIKLGIAATYSYINLHYTPGTAQYAHAYVIFFDIYWAMYFPASVAIFFSIEQILIKVLSPLPGLSRMSVIIFRFTGILTFCIAVTAHLPELRSLPLEAWINAFFISVALCMCVFEVALMSMLLVAAPRLGLSFKTRVLGLSLGICFLGLMDFLSLLMTSMGSKADQWAGLSLTGEVVVVGTLLMWITYFVFPDQKRGPLRLTLSSTLMRWNDIVNQLGIGPQPQADQVPSFMSDVESVVERIMLRNQSQKS